MWQLPNKSILFIYPLLVDFSESLRERTKDGDENIILLRFFLCAYTRVEVIFSVKTQETKTLCRFH